MKMKTLAVAVAALVCGSQTFAAEVYNSDGTSMSIGGHVSVNLNGSDDGEPGVGQNSSRINVAGKKDIGNGIMVDAKGEWALNFLDGGNNSFTTRLGYIGATHESLGRVVGGTQWSPYFDVAGVADKPITYGNSFVYKNHGVLGTARADRMISYRKSIDFSDDFSVKLGLGWQGERSMSSTSGTTTTDTTYDSRGQIALSTRIVGLGLGYAYSTGDVDEVVNNAGVVTSSTSEEAKSHIFSVNYGKYRSGFYGAFVYGMNEYFYDGLEETVQLEALASYGVNDWTLIVHHESVEDDKANETQYRHTSLHAEYAVTPSFYTYGAYKFDASNDIGNAEDDQWTLGARYYF